MVNAEGFPLDVAVVPGSVQDHHPLTALDQAKQVWPSLLLAILDGVFATRHCRMWSNLHGMHHEVVRRPPGQRGFVALPC